MTNTNIMIEDEEDRAAQATTRSALTSRFLSLKRALSITDPAGLLCIANKEVKSDKYFKHLENAED